MVDLIDKNAEISSHYADKMARVGVVNSLITTPVLNGIKTTIDELNSLADAPGRTQSERDAMKRAYDATKTNIIDTLIPKLNTEEHKTKRLIVANNDLLLAQFAPDGGLIANLGTHIEKLKADKLAQIPASALPLDVATQTNEINNVATELQTILTATLAKKNAPGATASEKAACDSTLMKYSESIFNARLDDGKSIGDVKNEMKTAANTLFVAPSSSGSPTIVTPASTAAVSAATASTISRGNAMFNWAANAGSKAVDTSLGLANDFMSASTNSHPGKARNIDTMKDMGAFGIGLVLALAATNYTGLKGGFFKSTLALGIAVLGGAAAILGRHWYVENGKAQKLAADPMNNPDAKITGYDPADILRPPPADRVLLWKDGAAGTAANTSKANEIWFIRNSGDILVQADDGSKHYPKVLVGPTQSVAGGVEVLDITSGLENTANVKVDSNLKINVQPHAAAIDPTAIILKVGDQKLAVPEFSQ